MNDVTPDQSRLLDEAIDLVIRLQNDPENPVALEMIRSWRARGPEFEKIWLQVAQVHGASGRILTEKRRIERRESLGLTRRNFMVGAVTAFGAGVGAYTFGPGMVLQARADYMTEKGEIRRINLADGSVATLGPASAIAQDFQTTHRNIRLLAGMCYFEVASEANRPFSVLSENLTATALGTAFDVSNDAGVLTVSVDHGLVDVQTSNVRLQDRINLGDGQWMSFDPSGTFERGQRDAGQVASWRENLVIAERETVSALIARIGRWLPGRIIIADPTIGNQRISGVFDLNNPLVALQAVVHPAGARVRQISSVVTVISPI